MIEEHKGWSIWWQLKKLNQTMKSNQEVFQFRSENMKLDKELLEETYINQKSDGNTQKRDNEHTCQEPITGINTGMDDFWKPT